MADVKVLWFDTETTGLSALNNTIVQLAAIVEIGGVRKDRFEFKCAPVELPLKTISPDALKTHGFTIEEMRQWTPPKTALNQFKQWMGKYVDPFNKADKFVPAGWNSQFDINMLQGWFEDLEDKYCFSWIAPGRQMDLMRVASWFVYRGIYPQPESNKLTAWASMLGLDTSGAHDAFVDIELTYQIAQEFKKWEIR